MLQRWLGAMLLHCENQFYRIRGSEEIGRVVLTIEAEQVCVIKQAAISSKI